MWWEVAAGYVKHESSRILRDELMERGEKGCNLICDEVAPLSTGKDEEKEGPSLPSFALRLGEMSEKQVFPLLLKKPRQRHLELLADGEQPRRCPPSCRSEGKG